MLELSGSTAGTTDTTDPAGDDSSTDTDRSDKDGLSLIFNIAIVTDAVVDKEAVSDTVTAKL